MPEREHRGLGSLGPIDQVAYVVADLAAALPTYEALYGPFEVGEAPMEDCLYRGERVACTLRLAVNRASPVEIELIQVLAGRAPHQEFLERHGEGLHHVRFRVGDLESEGERLCGEGYTRIFEKRFAPGVAFAYLETPAAMGATVIELLEMPGA